MRKAQVRLLMTVLLALNSSCALIATGTPGEIETHEDTYTGSRDIKLVDMGLRAFSGLYFIRVDAWAGFSDWSADTSLPAVHVEFSRSNTQRNNFDFFDNCKQVVFSTGRKQVISNHLERGIDFGSAPRVSLTASFTGEQFAEIIMATDMDVSVCGISYVVPLEQQGQFVAFARAVKAKAALIAAERGTGKPVEATAAPAQSAKPVPFESLPEPTRTAIVNETREGSVKCIARLMPQESLGAAGSFQLRANPSPRAVTLAVEEVTGVFEKTPLGACIRGVLESAALPDSSLSEFTTTLNITLPRTAADLATLRKTHERKSSRK